jgi:hypothetical protein
LFRSSATVQLCWNIHLTGPRYGTHRLILAWTYVAKIFYTGSHPRAGEEEDFPLPDNASKMRRSVENAEHVGKYERLIPFPWLTNQGSLLLVLVSITGTNSGVDDPGTTGVLLLPLLRSTTTKSFTHLSRIFKLSILVRDLCTSHLDFR